MAKGKTTRTFRRSVEQIHDLYRLEEATFLKNIAWQEGVTQYDQLKHVHYFHSIDSKGTPQKTSTHCGGHFHIIEVIEPATDTSPAKYKTSGPMKWAYKKLPNGSMEKVMIAFDKNDTHTHEMSYIDSHKLVPRKTNMEAQKIIAAEQSKGAPIPGIIG